MTTSDKTTANIEQIPVHGGELCELLESDENVEKLKNECLQLPSWDLTSRQVWDLEMLLNGAFSPLKGFLTEADYNSVCQKMRLGDGTLWPIPVTLDVAETFGAGLSPGDRVALRHPEGMVLAVISVTDVWTPDKRKEAEQVFATTDDAHPGVFRLLHDTGPVYVGGTLEGLELPPHHTFQSERHTPGELRHAFAKRGWTRIVAFQTRNPMHRAHVELTKNAAARAGANLLLHPVVGRTSPGDVDYFTRVRCYQALLPHYPEQTTMLSLLPLQMRMGGPREALWHAIIRKNFGCTHFIVGRDHAGPRNRDGEPFYGPYDAQGLVKEHEKEIGIQLVTFEEMVFVEDEGQYLERSKIPEGAKVLSLSGTEMRKRLKAGRDLPSWFTYPEVTEALRRQYKPRHEQGFTVFFTGLPSSGKSTIANILVAKLMEEGSRPVTLLDGDIVRKNLSSELTFSKEHRNLNIERIGFVASEITKNGGVAVCAPIAPYAATRRKVEELIDEVGGFILVHVDTPVEVCEQRDRKGLYAKARAGIIKEFTGVSDPYEVPENADIRLDTTKLRPDEAAEEILTRLVNEGYLV